MAAIMIGAAAGVGALFLLAAASSAILAGQRRRALLAMLGNAGVLLCALLVTLLVAKQHLLPMGVGLIAGLMVGAIVRFALGMLRERKKGGPEE